MKAVEKFIVYIKTSFQEVATKVVWPRHQELEKLGMQFFGGLTLTTILIGGMNIGLQKVSTWFYSRL